MEFTELEQIFIIIFWIILGAWISYKKDWYYGDGFMVFITVLISPLAFIITFFKQYMYNGWK